MTTLTTYKSNFDMLSFTLSRLHHNFASVFQDSHVDVVVATSDPQGDVVLEGSGFSDPNGDGFVTKGTVTTIGFGSKAAPLVTFSDFSASAGSLAKIFSGGQTASFVKLMFSGDDHFQAGSGAATFLGFDGNDTMQGGKNGDDLVGGKGDDTLNGGGGNDFLQGSTGQDTLTGGKGNDDFIFQSVAESHGHTADTITDLTNTDIISLVDIDANSDNGSATNEDFVLVTHFSHTPGELVLHFDHKHNVTLLEGDTNGDGKADLLVYLDGNQTHHTNFEL